ncbi:MAG: hypothetical protein JO250_23505 [Armatimonadetes bacterium]|nr:hypothetical protein [Armatimonadota bacterium]
MSSDNALDAVHRVLTRVRSQAYMGLDSKQIGRILDDAEYLVTMIRNNESEHEFRLHLEDIESKFSGFDGLVQAYDEGQARARKVA